MHETTATASAKAVLPTSPMVPLHGNDNDKQNHGNDSDQHTINHDTTTGDDSKQDVDHQGAHHRFDFPIDHNTGSDMDHGVDHDIDHNTDYDFGHDIDHDTDNDSDKDDDNDDDHETDNDSDKDDDNDDDNDIDHDSDDTMEHAVDDNNDHSTADHNINHDTFNDTTSEIDHDLDDDKQDDDEDDIPSNTTISKNKSGLTVMLQDDKNFCLFLPSSPGNRDENNGKNDPSAISDSEKSARVFCTSKSSQHAVPGGKPMPKGFIKSATFASDRSRDFVQVTGSIDRDAYALSPKDGGGQVQISVVHSHSSRH